MQEPIENGLTTDDSADERILLVGNPNVGKSVIFGALTKRYVIVSNYPGTTVEVTRGNANLAGKKCRVVDTPGVNCLIPSSEDEQVTRDILLEEPRRKVIQVADAKNLRRALLITLGLIEMGVPFILVLNMADEARSLGLEIDTDRLSRILGVPVTMTIATRNKGIDRMTIALEDAAVGTFAESLPDDIEKAAGRIAGMLPKSNIRRRSLAMMLVAGDETLSKWLHAHVSENTVHTIEGICRDLASRYPEPLSYVINTYRLRIVDGVVAEVLKTKAKESGSLLRKFGALSMHPIWGIPVLLAVLAGMYYFVGNLGAGFLVDLLEEKFFGNLVNPSVERLAEAVIPSALLKEFLVGPYGIFTMAFTYALAIVLPIVGTFFIAFGVLEDSGYMPRLAVMVNRLFKTVGLSGKAVLPMLLGLGCDTMATLTTRILDSRKERILVTFLLALGVPCSAQLGVILGMLGGLTLAAFSVWLLVILLTMIASGYIASLLVSGESSTFVLELPPIRVPKFKNILIKTVARIEWYLKEAVPLFVLGTIILFLMDKLKLLSVVQAVTDPVVKGWLGLPSKATEAFLIGFMRRDYGAAGIYALARDGLLDTNQILVSLVTITLFVPCIANVFIIIKERGWRTALWMLVVIFPLAFGVGGLLNQFFKATGWTP